MGWVMEKNSMEGFMIIWQSLEKPIKDPPPFASWSRGYFQGCMFAYMYAQKHSNLDVIRTRGNVRADRVIKCV